MALALALALALHPKPLAQARRPHTLAPTSLHQRPPKPHPTKRPEAAPPPRSPPDADQTPPPPPSPLSSKPKPPSPFPAVAAWRKPVGLPFPGNFSGVIVCGADALAPRSLKNPERKPRTRVKPLAQARRPHTLRPTSLRQRLPKPHPTKRPRAKARPRSSLARGRLCLRPPTRCAPAAPPQTPAARHVPPPPKTTPSPAEYRGRAGSGTATAEGLTHRLQADRSCRLG